MGPPKAAEQAARGKRASQKKPSAVYRTRFNKLIKESPWFRSDREQERHVLEVLDTEANTRAAGQHGGALTHTQEYSYQLNYLFQRVNFAVMLKFKESDP